MIDGQDRGGHEPGKAKQRADDDKYCNYEQIQVVAAAFLQGENASKAIISNVVGIICPTPWMDRVNDLPKSGGEGGSPQGRRNVWKSGGHVVIWWV